MTPEPAAPIGFVPVPMKAPKKSRAWIWVLLGLSLFGCGVLTLAAALASGSHVPSSAVLKITFDGPISERAQTDGLDALFGKKELSLKDHLDNLTKAASDPRIKGVVLKIEHPMIGWGKTTELRDALATFRKSGKFVIAYSEGLDEKGYALSLGADEVWMAPDSFFEFNGLAAEVLHYPGLLAKLGITVQYFRYGKYKSVSGEEFGRTALTEPVKEMINENLDAMYGLLTADIATARKKTPDEVKKLFDESGLRAEWAKEKGLIDRVAYWDEVENFAREKLKLEAKEKVPFISASKYRSVSFSDAKIKDGKHTFALVYSVGLIVAGKGGTDPFSGGDSQGATPIIESLRKAAEDKDVKAIIFRVDSPGGAGLGCDLVRREVERIREKKPVIVSMSDVAASGGYWVAMDATAIVAQPTTATGSIGIWAVVPNLEQTYQKLDLNPERFTRGEHADGLMGARPMNDYEAKLFDAELLSSYRRFVDLAAKGRKKTPEEMELVAQGRTWYGISAVKNGLVDKLGGFDAAIALGKEKAGLPATDTVTLKNFEKKRSFLEELGGDDDDEPQAMLWAKAMRSAVKASGLEPVAARLHLGTLSVIARELATGREHQFATSDVQVDFH